MKTKFLKMIVCTMLLCSTTLLHADEEGPGMGMEDEFGNVNDDELEAPGGTINGHLLFLAVAGVGLAFFKYRLKQPQILHKIQ